MKYEVGDKVVTIRPLYAKYYSGGSVLIPAGILGTITVANHEIDHYVVSYSNYTINVPNSITQITKATKLHKALN